MRTVPPPPFSGPLQVPLAPPPMTFFRELCERPRAVGAICSSSRRLGECMLRHLNLLGTGPILELGGGTGAITDVLLRSGLPPERLYVVEQSERFGHHLRHRFPAVRVMSADACEAEELLQDVAPFDAVVSSLPLHSLRAEAVERITHAGMQLLAPGAKLVQFTYLLAAESPWLHAGLRKVASSTVLLNMPPARVDVFERSP